MDSLSSKFLGFLFEKDKNERAKLIFLTLMYFFIILSYTLVKEFKNSVFIGTVGVDYLPKAKILGMIVLVPAILFYSYLVDKLKRYQLLIVYSLLYAIAILLFGFFISHPSIGILNTEANPYRLYGWFFYFFIEGFSPFIVSVFWAFTNSITDPEFAKRNYSLMVCGSKLGGMLSAGFAWFLLSKSNLMGYVLSDVAKNQSIFIIASISLFFVPLCVIWLIKRVPTKDMHGYEAVYKFEKVKEKQEVKIKKAFDIKSFFESMLSGLIVFIRQPYVLGIFGIIFFYESLNVVLDFLRLKIITEVAHDFSDVSCILFEQMFYIHLIGFFVALFGTAPLLRRFGESRCLLLIPIITGCLILVLFLSVGYGGHYGGYKIINIVSFVFVCIRAINYAITYPVRESLYIPTVKSIKFKAKSWIDAFGTKFAKSSGSIFNDFARALPHAYPIFFGIIIFFWIITAYLLGKKYDSVIKNNEVISE